MHKLGTSFLGAFILVLVLSFGTQVSWGYYPPLLATGHGGDGEVSFTVAFPWGGGVTASGSYPPGFIVSNFTQHNGVMAWTVQNGSTFSVASCTYDPFFNGFVAGSQGPFTSVSQLQVVDGVVAYVAGVPASVLDPAHTEFKYSTYDPAKGAWQHGQYWSPFISALNLTTKDGVVLLRYVANTSGVNFNEISWDIYDPKLGRWWPSHVGLSNYSTTNPITSVYINNATIYYTADGLNWVEGYNPNYDFPFMNPWGHNPTKPLAYFVAQPDFGSSPLWVWFTDMSIAGANWNYNFGDSTSSTSRSPYHTFTSPGNFQVSQQISGASPYNHTIIVGYPSTLKGKSLPGILSLLLLAD